MPLGGPGDASAASIGVMNYQSRTQLPSKHAVQSLQAMGNVHGAHPQASHNKILAGHPGQLGAADGKLSIQNHDLQSNAFGNAGGNAHHQKPLSGGGQQRHNDRYMNASQQQHASSQMIAGADKKKKKPHQSQQKDSRQSGAGVSGKNQSENILAKLQNLLVCKDQ